MPMHVSKRHENTPRMQPMCVFALVLSSLAARQLVPTGRSVWITGYGTQAEAPASLMDLGGAQVARPGMRIKLE